MDELQVGDRRIRVVRGDITRCAVDVIVNAANSQLAGGGGVDGAIHDAGGPSIMAELDRIRGKGCPAGSAVLTRAGDLDAKHVAHAVGPRWRGGAGGEAELLASAYRKSLELAEGVGAETIAFPSISTGVYGYPVEKAAPVALGAVAAFLKEKARSIRDATFVLFDDFTLSTYRKAVEQMAKN